MFNDAPYRTENERNSVPLYPALPAAHRSEKPFKYFFKSPYDLPWQRYEHRIARFLIEGKR